MHPEAFEWIDRTVKHYGLTNSPTVLDVGGRNVNGSIRDLFTGKYEALDIIEDFGVDIVADARSYEPDKSYDLVVSTETLEHVDGWELAVQTMLRASKGYLLITAACDPRQPHSGIDGGQVRPGEHYGNVDVETLTGLLQKHLTDLVVESHPRGDVYAVGRRK